MDEFYADRERYPHIGDFMPRLVEFLDETADNIDQVMKEYADQKPYIAEVTPAVGSTVMADALPSEVVVRFSEPISMNGYGMNWIQCHGIEHIPIEGSLRWQDEYTLVIPLDTAALEPGKTYGANLLGWAFRSQKGFPVLRGLFHGSVSRCRSVLANERRCVIRGYLGVIIGMRVKSFTIVNSCRPCP